MTNEQIIWNYLYAKLKNEYGTAGLMGNLFAESSLSPILANNVKKKTGLTSKEYTDEVDQGKRTTFATDSIAYGLAQWCYKTRKQALLDKAKSAGKSIGDINIQLDYLWTELQGYKTVINTLYSAKSIREASDIVLVRYEKPATQTEAVKVLRAKYGQKYYDKYANPKIKTKVTISRKLSKEIRKKLEKALK